MKNNRASLWLLLLGLAIIAMATLLFLPMLNETSTPLADPDKPFQVLPSDVVKGEVTAPQTLVAFVSLTCPHCQRWEQTQLPVLENDLVSKGKLRVILRDFPTDAYSWRAAAFVSCTPVMARSAVHRRLMAAPEAWAGKEPEVMVSVSELPDSEAKQALSCATDKLVLKSVMERAQADEAHYQITGTPTFIIAGKVKTGEQSAEEIENELRKATP